MNTVTIFVPGEPQGKARARTVRNGGRVHSFTPAKTVEYEDRIRAAYIDALQARVKASEQRPDKAAPKRITIRAFYEIPKSASKAKREAMSTNEVFPTKKPDADNIAKIVLDALNGIAYDDDTQVIDLRVIKRYQAVGFDPEVVVTIEDWEAQEK